MQKRYLFVPLTIVLLFFFGVSFFSVFFALHPDPVRGTNTPADAGLAYEEVSFPSLDGLRIAAWLIPHNSSKGIIVVHGYPFDKSDTANLSYFLARDYNLLLIDLRNSGGSEGSITTFGFSEWRDILGGVAYLQERGISDIGVLGFSLGGASALLALPHTADIKAVVADSAFADVQLLMHDSFSRWGAFQKPMAFLAAGWVRILGNFDPAAASPAQSLSGSSVPVFIIHEQDDSYVSLKHARLLSQASPAARLWVPNGSRHALAHDDFTEEYEQRVRTFFQEYI
ncbi:alpha/beta fold hydrolase [Candidatus Woesearchaeota archaeon]|nr:alpha/beta fold hydrolase [Candidatus Woesearchaeota archaeon]